MNPYELRFSVLNTAKNFLENQYQANVRAYEMLDKASQGIAPKFPTMSDIIDKAIEINGFISDATQHDLVKIAKLSMNENFVTELYKNIMGRAPEEAGYKYWIDALNTNKMTLSEVIAHFLHSDEFKEKSNK
jgi:hypothetical protein